MQIVQGPLGAANQSELGHWLGISRNRVHQFMGDLGVQRHGSKYPWRRVIECVLGLAPEAVSADLIETGLMTLVEAAQELGLSADGLKGRVLRDEVHLPPLYVFGPNRHRLLRRQVLELVRSPRNLFPELALNDANFLSPTEMAQAIGRPAEDLTSAFEAKELTEPKHVLLTGGEKRYFKAAVQRLCLAQKDDTTASDTAPQPVFTGGVLGAVARSVAAESAS